MEFLFVKVLIVVRIAVATLVAPMFASRWLPWTFRIPMAVIIGMAVSPAVSQVRLPVAGLPWSEHLFSEVLLGLLLGGGVALVFSCINLTAEVMVHTAGMRFAADPQAADDRSASERLLWFVALGVFLLMRGPEMMLLSLCGTFEAIPAGDRLPLERQLDAITLLLQQSLWLSLYALGPILAAYYSSYLAMGLLSRTVPQLSGFVSGVNVNVFLYWGMLIMMICGGVWILIDQPQAVPDSVSITLTEPAMTETNATGI